MPTPTRHDHPGDHKRLSRDPEQALRVHAVSELGLDPDEKPSPTTAAVTSFLCSTARPWWSAGPRQLLFGAVAAAATYRTGLTIGAGAA